MGKIASVRETERYCETCKRTTRNTVDCWGKYTFCGRFGHKSDICRNNPKNQTETEGSSNRTLTNTAKVAKKKKKKKFKKETGKTALEKTVETKVSTEEESESEEDSEEDSPKQPISNRADRVGMANIAKRTLFRNSNLNTMLSNMNEEDQEEW